MLFNLDKSAVIHFGFKTLGSVELGGKVQVSHTSEIDLGVIVQCNSLNSKVDMQSRQQEKVQAGWLGWLKFASRVCEEWMVILLLCGQCIQECMQLRSLIIN